ncbi:MAG: foldase protein PrsA [Persicimonas sp.]
MLVASGLVWGCDGADVPHESPEQSFLKLERDADSEVVARVGDRAVSLAELEAFWADNPEMSREEAVEALVERELLVIEALERDYLSNSTLGLPRKRAMVRQLLRDEIEREITRETLTDDEIGEMESTIAARVGHPPGLRASHILVMVPREKKKKKLSDQRLAELRGEARQWLDRIAPELPEDSDAIDLLDARDRFEDEVPEPLQVVVNAHLPFPVGDTEGFGADFPAGWAPVVSAFQKTATDLAAQGRFGELSEPVESKFGWHLLIVEEALDGSRPDADALREVAVDRLLQKKRNERLVELMETWLDGAEVQTFPEILTQAEEVVRE